MVTGKVTRLRRAWGRLQKVTVELVYREGEKDKRHKERQGEEGVIRRGRQPCWAASLVEVGHYGDYGERLKLEGPPLMLCLLRWGMESLKNLRGLSPCCPIDNHLVLLSRAEAGCHSPGLLSLPILPHSHGVRELGTLCSAHTLHPWDPTK